MKKFRVLIKVLATAIIASIMMCTVSCADTTWAVKTGEYTVPAGVYLGYLTDAYYTASYSVTDQNKDLFDQKIGDKKAADYIKDTAMDSVEKFLTVEKLFDEYKLSFTKDETKVFEATLENYWASLSALYEENGCGKESYRKILLNNEKTNKIFEYYYSKDGKEPVSEKDRKEFFTKNYAKIQYIDVKYSAHFKGVTTESTATAEQKDELKKFAEGYITRLNKGEKIEDLIKAEAKFVDGEVKEEEKEEEHTHEEGEEHNHEEEETKNEPTFVTKDTSDKPDEINAAFFKAKFNTPTLIKNGTSGYYVFVRYKMDENGKDYTDRASSVLSNMKSEDFEKVMDKAIEKISFSVNKSAIRRFKPQNVIINF